MLMGYGNANGNADGRGPAPPSGGGTAEPEGMMIPDAVPVAVDTTRYSEARREVQADPMRVQNAQADPMRVSILHQLLRGQIDAEAVDFEVDDINAVANTFWRAEKSRQG
jgi:hypothetical protein